MLIAYQHIAGDMSKYEFAGKSPLRNIALLSHMGVQDGHLVESKLEFMDLLCISSGFKKINQPILLS